MSDLNRCVNMNLVLAKTEHRGHCGEYVLYVPTGIVFLVSWEPFLVSFMFRHDGRKNNFSSAE